MESTRHSIIVIALTEHIHGNFYYDSPVSSLLCSIFEIYDHY